MTVTARTSLIGGLLAATGELRAGLTAEDVLASLAFSVGPATVWCGELAPGYGGPDTYDVAVSTTPATWVPPDPALVESEAAALDAGWARVDELLQRPRLQAPWDVPPVIRLTTDTTVAADALRLLGPVEGIAVTSFIPTGLDGGRWHWPLRVVVDPRHLDAVRGSGRYGHLYDLAAIDEGADAPADIAVVDAASPPATIRAGVVVVIGASASSVDLGVRLNVGFHLRPGAVVALPDADLSWFSELVRELSHDRPLDAAVGLVRPDAAVLADPRFVAITALRHWTRLAATAARDAGDGATAAQLDQLATVGRFEHESSEGDQVNGVVRTAEGAGATLEVVAGGGGRQTSAVPPPSVAPPPEVGDEIATPAAPPPLVVGEEDEARAAPGAPEAPATDDRGLVTQVTDADGTVREDGFIAGRAHQLRLRIASPADAAVGDVVATQPLLSPTPGRRVDLRVSVSVGGSRAKPQTAVLRYPATGPGPWTKAMRVTPPRGADHVEVFVTVSWQGRVLQSAVLRGPVLAKGTPPGEPAMTLEVDVSSAPLVSDSRPAADATFVVLPGADTAPVVLDAATGGALDPLAIAATNQDIRRVLVETFQHPPASLAAAATPLAELATHGAVLRENLGGGGSFHDDASWIHVTSFSSTAVPFELLYTHGVPDLDAPVAVCAPALAGSTDGCADDCPDRDDPQRICPFAFWATSKTIERRQHTAERNDPTPSEQRSIAVRDGAVVGVTPEANAEDPTAADRIAAAVTGFVSPGTGASTTTWDELETALGTPRHLVCLVTHTVVPEDPSRTLEVRLQFGSEARRLTSISKRQINPVPLQPGPIVLSLGCDTATIHASFATFVSRLHALGAEIVVSAISQIPGKEVADFVERLMAALTAALASPGEHRFGAVLTAARRQTLLTGDVLALALTATGDGDVQLAAG